MPLLDYSIFPSSLFPYGMLTYLNFLSRAEIRLRRKTFLLWETALGPYLANSTSALHLPLPRILSDKFNRLFLFLLRGHGMAGRKGTATR